MKKFPSAKEIVEEAARSISTNVDINELHYATYNLMKKYREEYYKSKVKDFLSRPNIVKSLNPQTEVLLIKEMLKPLIIADKNGQKEYSNFMEEASRRISQIFQVISGNIAELCIEKKLVEEGLVPGTHYLRKNKRSDFTFYHPNIKASDDTHRVEVKNVKLRERAVRGLSFDGDSLVGFFDEPSEFSKSTLDIINKHCVKNRGYCYVPLDVLNIISSKLSVKRFKSNKEFAKDMVKFVHTGII